MGRKKKYVSEIIASLELLGPSTTTEISCFVLSQAKSERERNKIRRSEIRIRQNMFNKLIAGRMYKKTGKKKIEKYPGLVDHEFLKKIGVKKSKKNIDTNIWFPTLKGHIIALGYNFDDSELVKFLNNASRNSLFFAYLKNLVKVTSIDIVKRLFLNPISELVKNGIIDLNNDLRYSFWIIPFQIALEIEKTIQNANKVIYNSNMDQKHKDESKSILKSIEYIMDNTWYDVSTSKWYKKMIDLYYRTNSEKHFYVCHLNFRDIHFLYMVMQNVHYSYYQTYGDKPPSKYKQKFPIPIKRWKEFDDDEYNISGGILRTLLEQQKFKK